MHRVLAEVGPSRSLAVRRCASRPLVLEVGCGHGEAAAAFARTHPDVDVLATDVHVPGVVHLLEVARRDGLGNLYVERADALELLDGQLGSTSLAGVHLFFPDPWPKVRHHKRRFVRPDVLDLLADRMRPGAALLVATDVEAYAAHATAELDRHPRFLGGPAPRPAWRPVTRYEAAARAATRPITELRYERH